MGHPLHGLVLLPGTPDDENDRTSGGGFAHVMFDNMIAERSMTPVVIVMHASDVLSNGQRADNLKEFEPLLVNELVPEIKKRYRVGAKPESWAIAGLLLDGEFAMAIGLRYPELFRRVASINGSLARADDVRRQYCIKAAGIPHDFRGFAGYHVMPVFRREHVELLPRLFRLPRLYNSADASRAEHAARTVRDHVNAGRGGHG
jgi:Putative esterase